MELPAEYRNLSDSEIAIMKAAGCRCDEWNRVKVADGFDPYHCINVTFSGDIRLGRFTRIFTDESGVTTRSGISNAHLHNCRVGSDVLIANIGDYIANYNIENDVVIKNCGKIHTQKRSSFGNGTEVAVLNETGGRAVKIWDRLSAHEAYVCALYRHRVKAVARIEEMVREYSDSVASGTGTIGRNTKILNCRDIRNVRFGPSTRVDGAIRLNEGSVNSCPEDPVFMGPGVIMDHFIVCSGSIVTDSTLVDKCFIGQGCVLGKHYSAENSLFFANCAGFHGEACSIFAGPYTVTHHKSTLLIAGIFSFMNAGSGSNQSNHMYKLGPIHQGIMERGSKTTSDSYVLWPARIGPFTLVMGRHYNNVDTSSLPFSYLIERDDETILVPGVNLRSVGTIRDAQKWPRRDRRKDPQLIDQVNFNLLSPYTIRKMFEGRDLLRKLKSVAGAVSSSYAYNNMLIKGSALETGIEMYQKGINKFLGNSLIKRLENMEFRSVHDLRERLKPEGCPGDGEWVDLAGLIAPQKVVDRLLDDIESGKTGTLGAIAEEFRKMHENYYNWEWTWACERLEQELGRPVSSFTAADVVNMVEKWKESVIGLDRMLYEDARKEFNLSSRTGFGIDGGEEIKKLDFEQVRGDFESNGVVYAIQEHIIQKTALGDELIRRMEAIDR
ncbi:MAG TPA: DUF4954 family protein [Bacteroidales bacterium]|nr:DUF4954 family protein [Bacteroidales bacterium]